MYTDTIPDFPFPAVSAIGTVASNAISKNDGKVDFLVTMQDYICGGLKTSTIM